MVLVLDSSDLFLSCGFRGRFYIALRFLLTLVEQAKQEKQDQTLHKLIVSFSKVEMAMGQKENP